MKDRPVIILVEPQLGENIGFVARSMNNFGFSELRLVNPRDGWPNPSSESTAVKAVGIVRSAKVFSTFTEGTADLTYLYATSARQRDFNKQEISSKYLKKDIEALNTFSNKIGIVFGPERSGLDNDIISRVNKIIYIPTSGDSPSMNIAISVAIICYEFTENVDWPVKNQDNASQLEIENLFSNIENALDYVNFYKVPEKREKMLQNIRNIFKRVPNLNSNEVSTLIGIFKSIAERRNNIDKS